MSQVTVTIEQDTLTGAFARLGDQASSVLLAIAKDTADEFKGEVQSRLRRRWTGGTGRTADAVTIEKVDSGFRVTSGEMGDRAANLPLWLNYGTRHMTGEPAWDATRTLLAGGYVRRVEQGLQRAIDGLGAP